MRFSRLAMAALIAGASLVGDAAFAAEPERTITVSGEGEVRGVPDRATLSAGVSTVAPNAKDALAQNARKMNAVFDALKALGIPERAIQTSNLSVQPQYSDGSKGAPRITGYQVSNQVGVIVDDAKKLGAVIDTLVMAGANQIDSIGFSFSDPSALETKAREAAMADARQRAETYARAGGVAVGPVVSIAEGASAAPSPVFRAMNMIAESAPSPTAAGESSVSASVTVVYALK